MTTKIALIATILWAMAGIGVFAHQFGTTPPMSLNETGDFIAGLFSPLAFLWLVIGYFQQGQELKQNTRALELQANELKLSVQQQRELVAVTQADLALSREAYERQSVPQEKLMGSLISIGLSENFIDYEFCYTICNTGNIQFAIKEASILLGEHAIESDTTDLPTIVLPGEVKLITVKYKKDRASLPSVEGVEFGVFSARGNSYRIDHSHLDREKIWESFELKDNHRGY